MSKERRQKLTELLAGRETLASAIRTGRADRVEAVLNEMREDERIQILNSNEMFDSSVSQRCGIFLSFFLMFLSFS